MHCHRAAAISSHRGFGSHPLKGLFKPEHWPKVKEWLGHSCASRVYVCFDDGSWSWNEYGREIAAAGQPVLSQYCSAKGLNRLYSGDAGFGSAGKVPRRDVERCASRGETRLAFSTKDFTVHHGGRQWWRRCATQWPTTCPYASDRKVVAKDLTHCHRFNGTPCSPSNARVWASQQNHIDHRCRTIHPASGAFSLSPLLCFH
jgi:hypothetical protein